MQESIVATDRAALGVPRNMRKKIQATRRARMIDIMLKMARTELQYRQKCQLDPKLCLGGKKTGEEQAIDFKGRRQANQKQKREEPAPAPQLPVIVKKIGNEQAVNSKGSSQTSQKKKRRARGRGRAARHSEAAAFAR